VLVTGGTGFVGSWTTVRLRAAGHDVRLLVRRPDQVAVTFGPHGSVPDDVVVGDVADPAVVKRALEGCDAVVHAAAVFSFDTRRAEEMLATNSDLALAVLETAVAAGCDPVVHVSSTVTLQRRGGTTPDLPIGDLTGPYCRSKIASEEIARSLQDDGAPVVTVYPGAVYGPQDPYLGENAMRTAWVARGRFPLWPAGGMHEVDVRDVAAVVVAVMEPGRGPRRYVVPGHHMTADDLYGTIGRLVGRRRPHVELPPALVTVTTAPVDWAHRVLPSRWRFPADREGGESAARGTRFDTTPAEVELGVHARPFEDTMRDMLEWMVDAGHLPSKYRPAAASATG
jgi:nucleoside-diphosphate-sugar epimerase